MATKVMTAQERQMEVLTKISEQVEARVQLTKHFLKDELAENSDIGVYRFALEFIQCTKDRGEIARIRKSVDKLLDRYGTL